VKWEVLAATAFPIVALSVILFLLLSGCAIQSAEPNEQPTVTPEQPAEPAEEPTPLPNLTDPYRFRNVVIRGFAIQDSCLTGEDVEVEFLFHNTFRESITMSNPPEIWIMKFPNTSEVVRLLPGGGEGIVLEDDGRWTYRLTWDQKNDSGEQVIPGYYQIQVREEPYSNSKEKVMTWSERVEVLIEYPQGSMWKDIEVNKSQVITGFPLKNGRGILPTDITITLRSMHSRDEQVWFYALATFPNYPWERIKEDYPSVCISSPRGEYTVSGIERDAGFAEQMFREDGIWWTWGGQYKIDPIPSDAEKLTFTILLRESEPYEWQGSCEFNVPLN